MFRKILVTAVLIAGSAAANAALILDEGFEDVAGLTAKGWVMTNNSSPLGPTGWFQGDTGVFGAQSGAADSYVAANFLNAGLGGTIDNWLITPAFDATFATAVSFAVRSAAPPGEVPGTVDFPDNLQLLYSLGGVSTSDFISIGSISGASFTDTWSLFSLIGTSDASVRLAFRYFVTDTNVNGTYIGIDSFKIVDVPEPSTIALFAVALLMTVIATRRRRERA